MVEHLTADQEVPSSNLGAPGMIFLCCFICFFCIRVYSSIGLFVFCNSNINAVLKYVVYAYVPF